jgi:hypothetical protein
MSKSIGRSYLENLDRYLNDNLQTLKCSDIYDIYDQFVFCDLKEFRGNSNGFTGLSEFLIFRFLYNQLGGKFQRNKVAIKSTLYEFISKTRKIRIGQSIPVTIQGKRYYPDVVVYHMKKLIAVIQIKLYLTGGHSEVNKTFGTLQQLRAEHPELKALLIIFQLSKRGTIFPELQRISFNEKWFKFFVLEGNSVLFRKKLQDDLCLNRISS